MTRLHRTRARTREMDEFMAAVNGSPAWRLENAAVAVEHALQEQQAVTEGTISCNDCRINDDCPGFNDCPFINHRDPHDDTSPAP